MQITMDALHGRGYAPACRRSGEQAASHDGQRVFRKGVYLDRRGIAHREQGRGCRFPARDYEKISVNRILL